MAGAHRCCGTARIASVSRMSDANAEAHLHALTCTLPANVKHFHIQRGPVLSSFTSKYYNSARWSQAEQHERKVQRPSAHPAHVCSVLSRLVEGEMCENAEIVRRGV
ncbi:hypothetical protein CRENBAI_019321 [Crenichthys baileyi]|uniref:Uncharacterized protein n=1 Tax=Crenichthys baileyi TaxID=28760 RepID=A0AAV9QQ05_9TELE